MEKEKRYLFRDKPLVSLDDSPDYDSENDYELNKPEARKRGKSALLLLEEEFRNDLVEEKTCKI